MYGLPPPDGSPAPPRHRFRQHRPTSVRQRHQAGVFEYLCARGTSRSIARRPSGLPWCLRSRRRSGRPLPTAGVGKGAAFKPLCQRQEWGRLRRNRRADLCLAVPSCRGMNSRSSFISAWGCAGTQNENVAQASHLRRTGIAALSAAMFSIHQIRTTGADGVPARQCRCRSRRHRGPHFPGPAAGTRWILRCRSREQRRCDGPRTSRVSRFGNAPDIGRHGYAVQHSTEWLLAEQKTHNRLVWPSIAGRDSM